MVCDTRAGPFYLLGKPLHDVIWMRCSVDCLVCAISPAHTVNMQVQCFFPRHAILLQLVDLVAHSIASTSCVPRPVLSAA